MYLSDTLALHAKKNTIYYAKQIGEQSTSFMHILSKNPFFFCKYKY